MLQYSGIEWYLLELVFYGSGVGLYAVCLQLLQFPDPKSSQADVHSQFRVPERFAPGKFDIWGSSHQIFHVAILCAMYTQGVALTKAYMACHTLDLCGIQAAHG